MLRTLLRPPAAPPTITMLYTGPMLPGAGLLTTLTLGLMSLSLTGQSARGGGRGLGNHWILIEEAAEINRGRALVLHEARVVQIIYFWNSQHFSLLCSLDAEPKLSSSSCIEARALRSPWLSTWLEAAMDPASPATAPFWRLRRSVTKSGP